MIQAVGHDPAHSHEQKRHPPGDGVLKHHLVAPLQKRGRGQEKAGFHVHGDDGSHHQQIDLLPHTGGRFHKVAQEAVVGAGHEQKPGNGHMVPQLIGGQHLPAHEHGTAGPAHHGHHQPQKGPQLPCFAAGQHHQKDARVDKQRDGRDITVHVHWNHLLPGRQVPSRWFCSRASMA